MSDNFDDLFASDEFDGFDDLSDFDNLDDLDEIPDFSGASAPDLTSGAQGELDEVPDFSGLGTDDLGLAGDDPELQDAFRQDEGRSRFSRGFVIGMLLIGLLIVCIVVVAVVYALSQDEGLSEAEQLNTEVPLTNTAIYVAYAQTVEALNMMATATQGALATSEAEATALYFQQRTQEAQMTLDAAASATAVAEATAAAEATTTARQAQLDADATATAEANMLAGTLLTAEGTPIANATIRLYRDEGDDQFMPGGGAAPGGTSGPVVETGPAQPISYMDQVTGTLEQGGADAWTFGGSANDVVLINAVADDPVQMDLVLRLLNANGRVLVEDDDSGQASNPAIQNFTLPESGQYTIQVSSVAAGGGYTLTLSLGLTVPPAPTDTPIPTETPPGDAEPTAEAGATEEATAEVGPTEEPTVEAEPTQETNARRHVPNTSGIMLVHGAGPLRPDLPRQQGTPVGPEDDLVNEVTTGPGGEFDFGSLEPGTYWIEVPYDQLPPDQQAQVEPGTSMFIQVEVPVVGEATFQLMPPAAEATLTPQPSLTEEPGISPFDQTATAFAVRDTATPSPEGFVASPTPTLEPGADGTLPTMIPDAGFFDDIGGDDGGLAGTSGLMVLAIAAAGLIAVVFIARRLRSAG